MITKRDLVLFAAAVALIISAIVYEILSVT
jgi:hypothetical protein